MVDVSENDAPARTRPSRRRWIATIIVVAVILILLIPVSNLFLPPPATRPLVLAASGDAACLKAAAILEENCLDCHSDLGTLPFYARFPVANGMIQADMAKGTRWMNMLVEFSYGDGAPPSETALAKLEYVLERGTMPPARYALLHWNRALSAEEKAGLLEWIPRERRKFYRVTGVPEELGGNALQPLPRTVDVDPAKVALGEMLYNDVRLSGDDSISCASCHALDRGGTDQSRTSVGIGGQIGPVNAPTVFNSSFNVLQFWDGRAADLREQAAGPVHNPIEMGSSWEEVLPKLQADGEFMKEFTAVYADGLSGDAIADAIAEFERSLVTPDSRFDQYLTGRAAALSPEEVRGYELFLENGCATCHVGPALGGRSFELVGRARDYFADRGGVEEVDYGRYNVTRRERDRHRFKVPILRNAALTHPYFHDGTLETLEEAVKAMADYQAYRPFSKAETDAVVAFLKTLTGEYAGETLR